MDEYLQVKERSRGYVADAQTMYNLSKDWYRGRMDEDWDPPAPEEVQSIFERHGLTGDFWRVS